MAVKKIELPAKWLANVETDDRTASPWTWSVTTVENPIKVNTQVFAYDATSMSFGSTLGFDFELLSKAVKDDNNLSIKFKIKLEDDEVDANIIPHTLDKDPEEYGYIGSFKYDENMINIVGKNTGWNEFDLTSFKNYFANDATGIAVLPSRFFDSAYEPIIILEGSWKPNRPKLNSPVGGVLEDRTKSIKFSWNHDGIYPQTGFELRYRKTGSNSWNTIKKSDSKNSYTLPKNKLSAEEYEWQVKTEFNNDTYGDWSSIGTFNATEETNAPNITKPSSGKTLDLSDLYIDWESVSNQVEYEIELRQGSKVIESYSKSSSENNAIMRDWLANGESYIVALRVKADGEFWSDWAQVNISVDYAEPAKPSININENEEEYVLELSINNPRPSGNQPDVAYQDLYKKINSSWVKVASKLPAHASFNDYAVASDKKQEYRLEVYGDNDTKTTSSVYRGTIKLNRDVINSTNNPDEFVVLWMNPERSFSTDFNAVKKKFTGRKKSVTEFGEIIELESDLSYLVGEADMIKLNEIAQKQDSAIYRDVRGRKHYITINSMAVADDIKYKDFYKVDLSISEVHYDEGVD